MTHPVLLPLRLVFALFISFNRNVLKVDVLLRAGLRTPEAKPINLLVDTDHFRKSFSHEYVHFRRVSKVLIFGFVLSPAHDQ